MEPEITLTTPRSSLGWQRAGSNATTMQINPPASRQVFESLDAYLTPPHSMTRQPGRSATRSGAYDNLAAHCLEASYKPDIDVIWAYRACMEVIKEHSKSFYFSARMLPPGKREGIMALYAFCRVTDDIVDDVEMGDEQVIRLVQARLNLGTWARANRSLVPTSDHPVIVAWADARSRYEIPQALADELLEGVKMDLTISRYETWDSLWLYCYRVASTVGLMSMYITGADTMEAVPYAVQLGVALQLTNILRDIGEDAQAGRIYLPAEDMERFGYTEEMLLDGIVNEQFIRLIDFEIERATELYNSAWQGIYMLPRDSRMAVAAAATVYRGILGKITAARYDVFRHRAHLNKAEKLRAIPLLWIKTKLPVKAVGRQV